MANVRDLLAQAQAAEIRGDKAEAASLLKQAAELYRDHQNPLRAIKMLRQARRLEGTPEFGPSTPLGVNGGEQHGVSEGEAHAVSGREAYEVSGREAYGVSGREAYEVSGREAYEVSGREAYGVSGREAYGGQAQGVSGKEARRGSAHPLGASGGQLSAAGYGEHSPFAQSESSLLSSEGPSEVEGTLSDAPWGSSPGAEPTSRLPWADDAPFEQTQSFVERGPTLAPQDADAWCSFCCRPRQEVGTLVAAPTGTFICAHCLRVSAVLLGLSVGPKAP